MTVSTPELRARLYERLVVKASQPSLGACLNCSSHPNFKDVLNIPQDHTDFSNKGLEKVGDIFEGCVMEWEPMMELVLKGIFEVGQTLESFTFPGVSR